MRDDMDHLAVVGAALAKLAQPSWTLATPNTAGVAQPSWLSTVTQQGVSQPSEELDYLPLSQIDYTNATGGTIDYNAFLEAFPQRPFRGERLILQCTYITGAGVVRDGLFQMTLNPALFVGATQVGASQGNMPASAFAPNSFGVRLSMPSCGQGTRVYMPFTLAGLGNADRIVVAGGIFGRAVR